MLTIKKLSSNGFLTEEGWKSCDKFKVLIKPIFLNLKVGDSIDNIKYKNVKGKDYVIDFTIHKHVGQELADSPLIDTNNSLNSSATPDHILTMGADLLEEKTSPKTNSSPSPQVIIKDKIRFGQCVNLAFNSTNLNGFKSEDEWIDFTFKRAEKIYKRYEVY